MSSIDDEQLRHLKAVAAAVGPDEVPESVGDGRYQILGEIARGGMGVVLRARDQRLDRDVAVKLLATEDPAGEIAGRMLAEARVLGQLEHPGIVPVHDAGILDDERVFVTMKLVRGQRLDEHALTLPSRNERIRLFLRVCEPVAFAHEHGVIHRDLKPANVMVAQFGEVLVLDWGVAHTSTDGTRRDPDSSADPSTERRDHEDRGAVPGPRDEVGLSADRLTAGRDRATHTGTVLGTPGWMAPEQEAGRTVDARADVFALGAILRHLAAGEDSPIDKRLAAVIRRATAADREDRYSSVPELAADTTRWLDGDAVQAYQESLWERAVRALSRYQTPILIVVSYLVVRWIVYLIAKT